MFELPADSPALLAGLAVAAAAFLAVTASMPVRPAPDATGVAGTIDSVAAAEPPTSAAHSHSATAVRLAPNGVTMRNEAGTAAATFAFGPVTPVSETGPLQAVLDGAHPAAVFETQTAFRQAIVEARTVEPVWRQSTEIQVRGVSWDGYRVTLVGV